MYLPPFIISAEKMKDVLFYFSGIPNEKNCFRIGSCTGSCGVYFKYSINIFKLSGGEAADSY
jgi:heterodisulfide reductase subunit C